MVGSVHGDGSGMSYTLMFTVDADQDVNEFASFGNAWGGAMAVWMYLNDKYFPPKPGEDEGSYKRSVLNQEHLKKIWSLQKRRDIPAHDVIGLFTTFDGAMVRNEHMSMLADHLDDLYAAMVTHYGVEQMEKRVNNIRSQASVLRDIAGDETHKAVCWQHNSITQNPWWNYKEDKPYNLNTGTYHWFIFDELKPEFWSRHKVVS